MGKEEKRVSLRTETLKSWILKPDNVLLVGILIFSFALRLYFLLATKAQALWWDESEYLSAAKHWAFDVPYFLNPQRPPLFQYLSSILLKMGLGEVAIKFLFVLLPSVALVYVVYLLGKEMFSAKIGLIAAFLTCVSWTFLFWTPRVQPDFFSMTFQVLSFYFMWKHWKNPNLKSPKFVLLAGFFAALGFYFKISALLVPMIFFAFILVKEQLHCLKNKYNYYFALAYIITLIPFFIWSFFTFHDPIAIFHSGYSSGVQSGAKTPLGWYNLDFIGSLTTAGIKSSDILTLITSNPFRLAIEISHYILFLVLLVGIIYFCRFFLYIDLVTKEKEKHFDAQIISILAIVITAAFYIFYIRGTEDRWVFLWLPFLFFIIGSTLLNLYAWGKKFSSSLATVVILVILFIGAYGQAQYADMLIGGKESSYLPVKAAGLWIKDNSNQGDKVLSISYPQTVYYSERNVTIYSDIGIENVTAFDKYINATRPRFIIVSIFEPHPAWTQEWITKNENRLSIAQAYFADEKRTQPMLIIYEIHYGESN